jgi:phage major head subunit gpT-like protein
MVDAITFPLLQSINIGVQTAFNTQLWTAKSVQDRIAYQATSTGAGELYPRLDMLPGLREWVGDRVVNNLSLLTFQILNREFEETIAVRKNDILDDKYGLLTPAAAQLGADAAVIPDQLVAAAMKAGHTAITYDTQNFFDTAHPNFNADGSANTVANYVPGAGPAWYLLDTTRVQRSFIFQRRKPFEIIPKFAMDDPQVFWNREFEWGVDGRCAAGYGLWQLGFMSMAPLTHDNVLAARASMASLRRPSGAPMGVYPNLLVVPTALWPTANALATNEFQPLVAPATSLVPNQARGLFTALENIWLN